MVSKGDEPQRTAGGRRVLPRRVLPFLAVAWYVMDVGRVTLVVLSPTERELLFEAGQHPFRAETTLDLKEGLSAFCDALS